jgi:hypothetical protein
MPALSEAAQPTEEVEVDQLLYPLSSISVFTKNSLTRVSTICEGVFDALKMFAIAHLIQFF